MEQPGSLPETQDSHHFPVALGYDESFFEGHPAGYTQRLEQGRDHGGVLRHSPAHVGSPQRARVRVARGCLSLASLPRSAKLSRQALPSGLPQQLLVASLDNEIVFRQSARVSPTPVARSSCTAI